MRGCSPTAATDRAAGTLPAKAAAHVARARHPAERRVLPLSALANIALIDSAASGRPSPSAQKTSASRTASATLRGRVAT